MKPLSWLLFLVISFATFSPADAGEDKGSRDYPPRVLPLKPERTVVDERHHSDLIYLKLIDGSQIEPVGGRFAPSTASEVESSAAAALQDLLKHAHVTRMITSVSPEQLREQNQTAERNLQRDIADVSRWFEVTVPVSRSELAALIDRLNGLTIVELAVPAAEVVVPPTITCSMSEDCETTTKQGYLYSSHGVNATSVWATATGNGIRVTNIEGSFATHSDLPAITVLNSNTGGAQHGTGTFGMMGAKRQSPKKGITGIAYGASYFFPFSRRLDEHL